MTRLAGRTAIVTGAIFKPPVKVTPLIAFQPVHGEDAYRAVIGTATEVMA